MNQRYFEIDVGSNEFVLRHDSELFLEFAEFSPELEGEKNGAANGARTHDLVLGKDAL